MEQKLGEILTNIVASDVYHAKWLNSLSMMENTGARKISRYEHPIKTGIIVLKHAAEEARHAYYLKKQISKLNIDCPDYSYEYMLAPIESHHYLHQLDVQASKYLKTKFGLSGRELKHGAYLLVTYAIEVRADMLYDVYQQVLTRVKSKVNVKSIILEEEGHLEEMQRMLKEFSADWQALSADMIKIENELFNNWMLAIEDEIMAASVKETMAN